MRRKHVGLQEVVSCLFLYVFVSVAVVAETTSGYAIVVSKTTLADPAWKRVVNVLEHKHAHSQPTIISWEDSPEESLSILARHFPRHTCFVARPEEVGRDFVALVHQVTRRLDADPYTDTLWGILTGFDADNAEAIARTSVPLRIKQVTAGTELAMDRVVSGEWYSELEKNRMVRKEPGELAKERLGPDDTTVALVGRLVEGRTDLFVTSGHATERNWQIGYRYRNGQFLSGDGKLWGKDLEGRKILIQSDNPKVWLPVGNCLAGHIDGLDAIALAFLNSAGVRQMAGYTVPTWFGYAGWGLLDYFVEQPGRFTLCEAFHANGHALIHRLSTDATDEDRKGLLFDRDVVAFYGDPAWEARMAPGKLEFDQSLVEKDGRFTLTITPRDGANSFLPVNLNGSQRGGRPVVAFFPRRLPETEIVEGQHWQPVITDTFVLVPLPPPGWAEPVVVSFQDRTGSAE